MREIGRSCLPVLQAHALDTGSDANLDHARLDGMSNINAGLQAGRALSVQGPDRSRDGEASSEGGSTELCGATSWRQDRADGDILDKGWVDLGAVDERLEGTNEQVCSRGVLESSLAALGEGSSQGRRHDDLENAR